MARSKPEPSPEEAAARRARYDELVAEEVLRPMDYFKHDADAHADPKLCDLRDIAGMEGFGRYWLLVEVLAGREGHAYEVEDRATGRDRWRRFAAELECDGGVAEAKSFVAALEELGLIDSELLHERGKVGIERLARNAYEMAEATAARKLGAWAKHERSRAI